MTTKDAIAIIMLSLATLTGWAPACTSEGVQLETSGADEADETQKAEEWQACTDAMDALVERGCPGGFGPRLRFGGAPIVVTDIEEVGIPICSGVGHLVEAEEIDDPQWVGTDIFQSSSCIVGCFGPACGERMDLCFAGWPSDGLCNFRCSDDIDEQSCRSSVLVCNGIEPDEVDPEDEACGIEPSDGDADDGG